MGALKTYSSDLTNAEWQRIKPLLPAEKPVGRWREVDLREVLDAIFYRIELVSRSFRHRFTVMFSMITLNY